MEGFPPPDLFHARRLRCFLPRSGSILSDAENLRAEERGVDSSEAVGSDGLGDKWTLDEELEGEPGMDRTREEPKEPAAWTCEGGDIRWVATGKRSREGVGRLAGGYMWQC